MATTGNVKISELTNKSSISGSEILPISWTSDGTSANYVSQSITTEQIRSYISESFPDVSVKENSSNKTTNLSSASTDTQYPSAKAVYDAINGYITTNTISSIPITFPIVKATISNGLSFSLASTPAAGKVINVIIYNNSNSDITITIPTRSPYFDLSDTDGTAIIKAKSCLEVNCISDGATIYLRVA